ncbi:MAG: flotillin family protein [Myxococcales bacterium]|nr:flotillin family protein [Myxococcales bacterium]
MLPVIITILMVSGFLMLCGLLVIRNVIYICQPNEVLIFSGQTRALGNREVGYRLVRGGRGIRTPLFETVDRLDLTNMIIELQARDAYAKGGIKLSVQAVANIKIANNEPIICNAIERFLGKKRSEIMSIAKETLEGNLRGVLASLTPEQVNEDKQAFEELLIDEAELDLQRLGLRLDSLKIQNITDDSGYLDSIGRRQSADLIRRSRIAEARNQAESVIQEALNAEQTSLSQVDAQISIVRAEAARRIADTKTKRLAMVAEQQSEVRSQIAKAHAELDLQRHRIEQVRRQLNADIIEPALAKQLELESEAKGAAASITENGRANAEVLREIARTWKAAGPHAREIFITQKLDTLVKTMVGTMKNIEIDKITVIDSKLGQVDASGSMPMKVASANEQLRELVGLDVSSVVQGLAAATTSRSGR